jgi:nicotinamide riboside kinase
MTKVINLLGGSGTGKSTTAAGLFYEMKKQGLDVELVNEYVKKWAWNNRQVGAYDQIYIFGKQAKSEYDLYGKVDYIITDSPLLLSPIYERYYNNESSVVESSVFKHLEKARNSGVEHVNFLINRTKPFNPKGRYETEESAVRVDGVVYKYLIDNNISFIQVTEVEQDAKLNEILTYLGVI